jgi:hypothetical protein
VNPTTINLTGEQADNLAGTLGDVLDGFLIRADGREVDGRDLLLLDEVYEMLVGDLNERTKTNE